MRTQLYPYHCKCFLFTYLILFISLSAYSQDKWEHLPNTDLGISIANRFEDIYFTDYLTGMAVNLKGHIYKTRDGGANWKRVPSDTSVKLGELRSVEFLDDGKTGIIGSFSSYVYRSTDGGESWSDIAPAIEDTVDIKYPKAMCGLAHIGNTFYGVGWFNSNIARFYKSIDKGVHWETHYMDSNLATGLVDVVFLSEDTGFVSGTRLKKIPYSQEAVILKTTDGGNTWTNVFSYNIPGGIVWKLQIVDHAHIVGSIQNDPSAVYMTKSSDRGDTWSFVNTGFENAYTQAVGFITPLKGWLGGHYPGMYVTTDGGINWDTLNFGNKLNRIFVMDSSHVYAAGQEIYRYGKDFRVSIPTTEKVTTTSNKLYPVVPNPSGGKVTIEFDLGMRTIIVMHIYNVLAQKIWEIQREVLDPGHYSLEWDAPADAPSGTYIVRMDNNEIVQCEQFVLIRK